MVMNWGVNCWPLGDLIKVIEGMNGFTGHFYFLT